MAEERIGRSLRRAAHARELRREFGGSLARVDHAARLQVGRDYQADRGAGLLREAFGIDVAEIDALNERLGDATEEELRGFLLDVQRYCTRPDEPPGPDDATSGTAVG